MISLKNSSLCPPYKAEELNVLGVDVGQDQTPWVAVFTESKDTLQWLRLPTGLQVLAQLYLLRKQPVAKSVSGGALRKHGGGPYVTVRASGAAAAPVTVRAGRAATPAAPVTVRAAGRAATPAAVRAATPVRAAGIADDLAGLFAPGAPAAPVARAAPPTPARRITPPTPPPRRFAAAPAGGEAEDFDPFGELGRPATPAAPGNYNPFDDLLGGRGSRARY